MFCKEFKGKVLINKRVWYDEYYNGHKLIGEVHHKRKNDAYLSTLEYFSSVNLLSKCTGLVAGNCGGSVGAALLNNGKYEYMYIFNLGTYK